MAYFWGASFLLLATTLTIGGLTIGGIKGIQNKADTQRQSNGTEYREAITRGTTTINR
jgi:hypothetical protein